MEKKISILELSEIKKQIMSQEERLLKQPDSITNKTEIIKLNIKVVYINSLDKDRILSKLERQKSLKEYGLSDSKSYEEILEKAEKNFVYYTDDLKKILELEIKKHDIVNKCSGKYSETNQCKGNLKIVYIYNFKEPIYMCEKCFNLLISKKKEIPMLLEGIDF